MAATVKFPLFSPSGRQGSLTCVDDLASPPAGRAAGTRASLPTARFLGLAPNGAPCGPKDSHWLPRLPLACRLDPRPCSRGMPHHSFALRGVAGTATASPTPSDVRKTLSRESRPLFVRPPPPSRQACQTGPPPIPLLPGPGSMNPGQPSSRADPRPDPFSYRR